jgi:cell division protein FtsW
MARKLASDKVLFVTLVALSLFGCVMIYSASAVSAGETSGNPYRFLVKQILALILGGMAAFVVYRTDYRILARPWLVYGFYAATLAMAVFALFRPPINAARRWIPMGFLMVQPSELLKVALVLLLAHQLARKSEKAGDPERALWPVLVFTGLAAAVVVLEPDLGTAACYVVLCAVLLWLAGVRARYFVLGALAAVPMLAILMLSADYRRARLLSFLKPEADPLGAGFQAMQSLIAVGAGGWLGNGLGGSRQKLFFLPYPHTDFIFAIVGEELGFVGALAIVVCFGIVAWRGRPGFLRGVPGGWRDGHDRGPGGDQPVRRAGPRPDQGDPAALRLLRRLVARGVVDCGRIDPERLAARGSGGRMKRTRVSKPGSRRRGRRNAR